MNTVAKKTTKKQTREHVAYHEAGLNQDGPKSERVWSIYCALWKRAQDDGAFVHYDGIAPRGEGGWFNPHIGRTRGPEIAIVRPYYLSPNDEPSKNRNACAPADLALDLLDELVTLAHEHGHFTSWKRGERTADYAAALDRFDANLASSASTDASDRALIVDEEKRAWRIGRETLTTLGFDEWSAFDERERAGLANYETRFDASEVTS